MTLQLNMKAEGILSSLPFPQIPLKLSIKRIIVRKKLRRMKGIDEEKDNCGFKE